MMKTAGNTKSSENDIYIYFSKEQRRTLQRIEGSKYKPKYVVIDGKSIEYTEKRNQNRPLFVDSVLLYKGPASGVRFV